MYSLVKAEPPKSCVMINVNAPHRPPERGVALTAKLPGAFRAAVQPHPRYSAKPSSAMMRNTPRPRNASGFVLEEAARLISSILQRVNLQASSLSLDLEDIEGK